MGYIPPVRLPQEALDELEMQAAMDAAERRVYGERKPAPQMLPSPGISTPRIPLPAGLSIPKVNIRGEFLDDISRGILMGMEGAPMARGGQGALQSGLRAFAGTRQAGANARMTRFQAEQEAAAKEEQGRIGERSNAARMLAQHRHQMARDAANRAATATAKEAADAARFERQERDFAHREMMQQLRFGQQLKIAEFRASQPESPGKAKALQLMVTRMAMNDPDNKEFVIVRDFHDQGLQSLKAKDSFGDLMAIRALAKVSDKLTGIREGEYDTFANAVGVLIRKGILVQSMVGRGMLTDTGREAIARELGTIYGQKKKHYGAAKEFYRGLAGSMDLNPDLVLRDLAGDEAKQDSTGTFDWGD